MASCGWEAEQSFGPAVAPCRRPPDFTLFFEEIIFRLLPSCLFIVSATIYSLSLLHQRSRPGFDVLCYSKLVSSEIDREILYFSADLWHFQGVATVFCALQLALLVWVCVGRDRRTRVSVPVAALDFVAALELVLLIFLEHTRSRRSSLLAGIYLSLTLLLRAACARTSWFLYGDGFLASTNFAAIAVQALLLATDSYGWRPSQPSGKPSALSLEESSSFLGRSFLSWILPLLLRGYRQTLDLSHLGRIDGSLASSILTSKFSGFISGHESMGQLQYWRES